MDHHLKFRIDSMKQAAATLGTHHSTRFPASSTPMLFRPKCKPVPLETKGDSSDLIQEKGTPEPVVPSQTPTPENPQVRQQVKQLQFWLKVFSRFCQDDRTRE